MPPIKQSQVIDNSVKKAFNDLNKALKTTIESLGLVLDNSKKINEQFNSATGIKQYNDAIKKLNDNRKEASTLTKQQLELLKKEEALRTAEARTVAAQERARQAKNRTAEQERKISEKQTKQQAKLTGAYSRQSKALTLLRTRAKNLAITYGENSKQFLQAEKRVVSLDNKLKKLDSRLGQSQREVGSYKNVFAGLNKTLGVFGLAAISAQAAIKQIGKAISSNQSTGDALDKLIAGWNNGLDIFYKRIAQGNFDNFFKDISKAVQAGREYAATLDDLGDRNRALRISEIELRTEIAKQEGLRQDQTKSNEERLKAAERVNELQLELLDEQQTELKKAFDAEVDLITKKLGFNKEELLSFLKNYREEESLREKAIDLIEKEQSAQRLKSKIAVSANQIEIQAYIKAEDARAKAIEQADEDVLNYANTFRKYLQTNDDELDKVVDTLTSLQNAELEYFNQSKRNISQLTGFQKQLTAAKEKEAETTKKVTPIIIEEVKKREDIQLESIDKVDAKLKESGGNFKEQEEYKTRILQEEQQKRNDLESQLQEQAIYTSIELMNLGFDNRLAKLDEETELIESVYEDRLDNELLDDEQRTEIEAQREEDLKKQAEKEKEIQNKQFLFNQGIKLSEIAIDTATKVAAIKANVALLSSNPLTLPFAPIAAAQIPLTITSGAIASGLVAAQSIPALDEGSENTPSNYLAGEIRPEFRLKNGKAELITTPTIFKNDAGAKIIGGEETANILDNISRSQLLQGVSENKTRSEQAMLNFAADALINQSRKDADRIIKAINSKPKESGMEKMRKTMNIIKKHAE